MAKRGRKPTTPLEKLQKALGEDLCAELEALDGDQLKARISLAEAAVAAEEATKAKDDELARAVEAAKLAKEPYGEAIKRQRQIQRYCHLMRESKGQV